MLFKVYLQNNDSTIQAIRQFPINTPKEVRKKISEMFFELAPDDNFTISWRDQSDDLIVATTPEELQYAFTGTKGELFIRKVPKPNRLSYLQRAVHYDVMCDNCGECIRGNRYKCLQCYNFDLCLRCEMQTLHSHHYVIRITRPLRAPRQNFNKYLRGLLGENVESDKKTAPDVQMKKEINLPKTEEKGQFSEERKLVDDSKDDEESESDNASNATQDESITKAITDEWTVIDKSDTVEVTQACSTLANTKETAEVNQVCSTLSNVDETASQACSTSSNIDETDEEKVSSCSPIPTAPKESSLSQTLAPQLSEKKVVHHRDPAINKAVETLINMGFSNQGGLLSFLLEDENGDINNVLQILTFQNI